MIKNLMVRGLSALALCALPLLAAPAAHSAPAAAAALAAAGVAGPSGVRAPLPLFEAIDRLPVAVEHREGYKRNLYKHWNRGLNSGDGCDTRKEVILAEAVQAPQVAAGCKLTGGSWRSAYDDVVVTDAARLDVDHFVPLAEVYDSEQTPRSAARREAYANDQNSPDTLIAVSAASNRSKADKDPAEWLPSDGSYHCTYAATWVATKLRWDLAVDENERQALLGLAEDCPTTTVVYEPAP
ncbi:HNH endonuclease family protein [Streptomyces sp. NPDC006656]|uniref:HNH endonuclease family protein n=1 Tax=Streptomyces sp. NPDC006656 TaxID=3156899 RepID=UPI003455A040